MISHDITYQEKIFINHTFQIYTQTVDIKSDQYFAMRSINILFKGLQSVVELINNSTSRNLQEPESDPGTLLMISHRF